MMFILNRFVVLLMVGIIAGGAALDGDVEMGSATSSVGSIRGKVLDAETSSPLLGVTVQLVGTQKGTTSDSTGAFKISNCAIGTYSLLFSAVGYSPVTQTDVVVRSGRPTVVDAGMRLSLVELGTVSVESGYFNDSPTEPTSSTTFSSEEIRRSAASAEDVSRIMFSLPSVAKVGDMVNNLIVRGGSPTENSFYVDNIEIPNINHYPLFGTSGGPISLINTDFIKDVTFSAGGFSAAYGDRLSSIMSLTFREGDRERFNLQGDFNMAGVGMVGEGPIGNSGSWMLSGRRSYLDLFVSAIGTGVVPKYSDYQGKAVFDLSSRSQLSVIGILGVDYINFDRETSIEEGGIVDGWSDGWEYAIGANWRYLWGGNGFSNTSVSYLATKVQANYFETSSGSELVDQNNLTGSANLRNVNWYRINDRHSVEFGVDVKYELDDFDHYVSGYTNYVGEIIPPLNNKSEIQSPRVGGFLSYSVSPWSRLTATFGARSDYFEYTTHTTVSPRFGLSWKVADRTTVTGAFGKYNQTLPLILLSQQPSNRKLNDPLATHYVAGVEQMLGENTRLRIEGYYKWYENFPMDLDQPGMFIIDEMVYSTWFQYHPRLDDKGSAKSYGVEVTLQRKLKDKLYGLVSASAFRTQYRDLNGTWRARAFDNRVLFSAEGGYKPNNKWEYSLRWLFGGGSPYTPLDLEASRAINRSVYDANRINDERYPPYHTLNLRVDRRYNFKNSNLVTYFSVWNVYNRENVTLYYWNEIEKKRWTVYGWSLMPVFGV